MTFSHRRLIIRKLVRFQNAESAIRAHAEAVYEIDSLVDGGEFCGPAIERATARQVDAAAQRLGFINREVAYAAAGLLGCELIEPAILHDEPAPLPL